MAAESGPLSVKFKRVGDFSPIRGDAKLWVRKRTGTMLLES